MRFVVSCQAKSKPRAEGTHVAIPSAYWLTSSGTTVTNRRRRRGGAVVSFRCVSSSSSNPSPCWLPLDTVEPRPLTRFSRRRSRRLRPGSAAAQERSGNYECHDLRDVRPSALEYSSDSFPNRCPPNVAILFPRAFEAHRSDSDPGSLARRGWPCRLKRPAQYDTTDLCF